MFLVNMKWYIFWVAIKGNEINFMEAILFWDPPLITGIRLMSIWVLAYHLYHYYRKQILLTAHNAELSILSKQIQLDNLSDQLNPHFLFNSLNSVKSLISEDPLKAKRSIDLLSEILRSSIYTKESLTTIENELQLVNDYIELEKLRFEERLTLQVTVDPSLLKHTLPSLCIQTLIENALKHGIRNSIKGGKIKLSIQQENDHIIVSVQNPGTLINEKDNNKNKVGLNNLKKRLALQYKEESTFSLIEKPMGLISATITIPHNASLS